MKYALLALVLASASAQAAPLSCNTNVDNNPRKGNTNVTITMVGEKRAEASQVTSGGMAHFITAPEKIDVTVKNYGPEVVVFENVEKGFELEVSYQPIGGKIRGTLKTDVFGQKVNAPVVCEQALN